MFFCDSCAKKKDWPKSLFKSNGKCEICGELAVCNDVQTGLLSVIDKYTKEGRFKPERGYDGLG